MTKRWMALNHIRTLRARVVLQSIVDRHSLASLTLKASIADFCPTWGMTAEEFFPCCKCKCPSCRCPWSSRSDKEYSIYKRRRAESLVTLLNQCFHSVCCFYILRRLLVHCICTLHISSIRYGIRRAAAIRWRCKSKNVYQDIHGDPSFQHHSDRDPEISCEKVYHKSNWLGRLDNSICLCRSSPSDILSSKTYT